MQSTSRLTGKDIISERFPVIDGQNQFQLFLREIQTLCENDKIDFELVTFSPKGKIISVLLLGEGSGVFRTHIHVFVSPRYSSRDQAIAKYFLVTSAKLSSGTRVRPQLQVRSKGSSLLRFVEAGVNEPVLTIQISHAIYS